MPRKTKDEEKNTKKNTKTKKVTETKKDTLQTSKKKTPSKTTRKTKKGEIKSKIEKEVAKTKNKTVKTTKKVTEKKITTKVKKNTAKSSRAKIQTIEYYDLPYRYNQTLVKILAQTPSTLFVYWDISDADRQNYIEQYGPYFFENTKPVLIIHNKTKNTHFEVEINDFANSWYLRLVDSNCVYEIELGRRPINNFINLTDNYLYISSSNFIESPNDHILLDELSHFVYFKNVKTNEVKSKTTLSLLKKIGKFSSLFEFYQTLYPKENINFNKLDLANPSSGNPTSSFK